MMGDKGVGGMKEQCVAIDAEIAVGIDIKQRGILDHVPRRIGTPESWSPQVQSGAEEVVQPLHRLGGLSMCFYNAIRYIDLPI